MLVVQVLLGQDVLTQDQFEHLHRLHAQFRGALESLLQLGSLIGEVALLLVGVLQRLAHLPDLSIELLDLLSDLLSL